MNAKHLVRRTSGLPAVTAGCFPLARPVKLSRWDGMWDKGSCEIAYEVDLEKHSDRKDALPGAGRSVCWRVAGGARTGSSPRAAHITHSRLAQRLSVRTVQAHPKLGGGGV